MAKERLQAQAGLTLPSVPPAGLCPLYRRESSVCGVEVGTQASEAQLPEDLVPAHSPLLVPLPHLTPQVIAPEGPSGSHTQGLPESRVPSCRSVARQSGGPRCLLFPFAVLLAPGSLFA